MKRIHKAIAGTVVTAALGMAAYTLIPTAKHDRTPSEAVHEMKWPNGSHVTGDPKDGSICHELHRQYPDGRDVLLKSHRITSHDFRDATDAERKAWIADDTLHDMEEAGMACNDYPGFYFQDATADPPTCTDCGGGCGAVSCPATLLSPGCAFGGMTCVITIFCCGPCSPGCG